MCGIVEIIFVCCLQCVCENLKGINLYVLFTIHVIKQQTADYFIWLKWTKPNQTDVQPTCKQFTTAVGFAI